MKKHVSLDLHDFSLLNNGYELLDRIKEHYPNFKLSAFMIPFDAQREFRAPDFQINDAVRQLKKRSDWIKLIPHGLTHMPREFEKCDRWTMKMTLESIGDVFKKHDLPFEKGFCAPYWLWNQEVIDVLDEFGWWGAIDRNQPDMLKPKKFYTYSHSIDEPFWESTHDILKLHGHMSPPSANSLEDCFLNLMKIPDNTEFHYVTDFIEDGVNPPQKT